MQFREDAVGERAVLVIWTCFGRFARDLDAWSPRLRPRGRRMLLQQIHS